MTIGLFIIIIIAIMLINFIKSETATSPRQQLISERDKVAREREHAERKKREEWKKLGQKAKEVIPDAKVIIRIDETPCGSHIATYFDHENKKHQAPF